MELLVWRRLTDMMPSKPYSYVPQFISHSVNAASLPPFFFFNSLLLIVLTKGQAICNYSECQVALSRARSPFPAHAILDQSLGC